LAVNTFFGYWIYRFIILLIKIINTGTGFEPILWNGDDEKLFSFVSEVYVVMMASRK